MTQTVEVNCVENKGQRLKKKIKKQKQNPNSIGIVCYADAQTSPRERASWETLATEHVRAFFFVLDFLGGKKPVYSKLQKTTMHFMHHIKY